MPPTTVHFNGGVHLSDAETVMREIAARVPDGVRRVPDGETGDRQNWIFFQLGKFWQTPGVEKAGAADYTEGYEEMPKVRIAEGADPDSVVWPDLGYATEYHESFQIFARLRKDGVLPADVRFQVQYPTPLASVNAYFVQDDQDRIEASYERALFTDLQRLLADIPHDQLAVQWDVAVEFALLEGGFPATESQDFDGIIQRLARCVDEVPTDVPVGLHFCYGDYEHQHFKQPESLATQVRVANALTAAASRPVSWYSFTVPQNRRDEAYFAPLRDLRIGPQTELYLALVPYYPADQEPGTTAEQVRLIDSHLAKDEWGICTECGMARAAPEDVPILLDKHREIIQAYSA
jgi:hypothetical protein